VLLNEILDFVPAKKDGFYLDLTLGGGGHLTAILEKNINWQAQAWDKDKRALERVKENLRSDLISRVKLVQRNFAHSPTQETHKFDFILADLGVSSFQFDPNLSGMSLHSSQAPDFRMNLDEGVDFFDMVSTTKCSEA
jgi:16S rRNA (cytosine1402-N4)-methyltransferase